MNSSGVMETGFSSGGVDIEGGRTSGVTTSVSDSPTGANEGSDKGSMDNTLSVSGVELSASSAGGSLMSVASVA